MIVSGLILVAGLGIALIVISYEKTQSDLYLMGSLLPVFWVFIYSGLRFLKAVKVCLLLILINELLYIGFSSVPIHVLIRFNFFLFTAVLIGLLGGYTIERYYRQDFINQRIIKFEKQQNEQLLLNILPGIIADKLKKTPGSIAKNYDKITVLFVDTVGFSK